MTYNGYNPHGGFTIGGCGTASFSVKIQTEFSVGQVVYYRKKAEQGQLERVAIKKVVVNGPPNAYRYRNSGYFEKPRPRHYEVVYVDTYNGWWSENELVTRDEAVALVEAYEVRRIELLSAVACKNS